MPRWDHKFLIIVVDHLNTKLLHDVQCNVDVRLRNQLTDDLDGHFALRQRCRHKKGGQKLTRDRTIDSHRSCL
ncbi:Uncharacterised protein [Vibrio cholerae]|uniref:Uncharacterized protein n=1 Tax=Vibrio cholerae TaxID=666 RepID=A0A655YE45_VIBCL|nr:Uncharacterised protein [Vibrio cholerae]CSB25374.1 Uncharacterised protein [Vibrio cholerae]CSB30410.1 Uncharacterised protein [Vibrio cholerae]CSB57006.1 Uncharacterised protein [Vibrio cholerae]CSC17040.1 Uncharacterised protein [Vibrio cholerae]